MLRVAILLVTWGIALQLVVTAAADEPVDADLVLVGGTVVDGSGQPSFVGDVAIRGDRIVAIGEFAKGDVRRTIACTGMIVAPGFLDLHNHSDKELIVEDPETHEKRKTRSLFEARTRSSQCYLTQGCTTIVTGNCGGGSPDVGEYYARLDEHRPGVNVGHLLPQGDVRSAVMGNMRRSPTRDEMQQMIDRVRQAMAEGAWGMSTGLQYVPSAYADLAEIADLAQVVGEYGGFYASHIRDEGDHLIDSIEEAIEIGRGGNLPVHVSHLKALKHRNWGKVRAAAAMIERARKEGMRVTADQYPYDASGTAIAAMLLPDEEREGSKETWIGRLRDPKQLPRLRKIVADSLEARGRIMIARCPDYPQWVGKMLRDVAAQQGREPVEVALDVLRTGNESGVSFSMDDQDVRFVMTLPWVATASDGSTKIDDGTRPHPRSYGTFSRRIGRYAIAEGVVRLEQAIRSASGLPADILRVPRRGYLREGYFADVVVFDPLTFRDHATFERPFEVSTGVRWLLVNGRLAIADGKLNILDAGRTLRKVSAGTLPAVLPSGEAAEVQMSAAALGRGIEMLQKAVERDELRGVVVLVARRGKVVLHEALGWRDIENKLSMEKDALFRMASNSKAITALGILLLVDEGRLGLDDRVGKYLPAFDTEKCRDMTVRHLLTHTSGLRIPDLFLSPLLKSSDQPGDDFGLIAEVNRFAEIGPELPAGTTWKYNNAGYNILAGIVEHVTGSFARYLRERIYRPLEMVDSCNHESEADHARMSGVFERQKEGAWEVEWRPGDVPDLPFPRGSGGMISTASDFAVFCQMMLEGGSYGGKQIVGERLVREATNPQTKFIAASNEYGLGWRVSEEHGVFSHGGSDGTWVWVDPKRELIGMVLTQTRGSNKLGQDFQEMVNRACVDMPPMK